MFVVGSQQPVDFTSQRRRILVRQQKLQKRFQIIHPRHIDSIRVDKDREQKNRQDTDPGGNG
ncbi:MAG: hypothetical protein EOO39_49185 [Cytophagaceae bacterium]|nr:MAG: hypothetical protein EOO39_49185 [Cytophagaceae bacterium]